MKRTAFLLIILLLHAVMGNYTSAQEKVDTLEAVIVRTDKEKMSSRSQTSVQKLDSKKLKRGFALLGSPDLVKSLQMLPGVSSGSEIANGIYVRGGDGSDNLYLLDGVPLYQVNHVIGLFSSFNVDMVDEVDFYKGGFPARYGGRLSSVVDVDVKEGNFTKWKGTASLGIIDGRFQIEGPLVKNKTSLNFGIRRTWFDLAKLIAKPFVPKEIDTDDQEEVYNSSHFDFTDLNLKVTHLFSNTSKFSLSAYYGHDWLTSKTKIKVSDENEGTSSLKGNMRWGNAMAVLRWNKIWDERDWMIDTKLYYTNYTSDISTDLSAHQSFQDEDERYRSDLTLSEHNFSRIYDAGFLSDWYHNGMDDLRLRAGFGGIGHFYDPYRKMDLSSKVNSIPAYENHYDSAVKYRGAELSAYAEGEIDLWNFLNINAGLRDVLFMVSGKTYNHLEPRVSFLAEVSERFSLKASYASMSQFSHLVNACYIDLPTSLWMPSTSRVKPMVSGQFVLGAKYSPNKHLSLDVEGFYKTLSHLYEYNGTSSILPELNAWEASYVEGEGRAYGAELSVEYTDRHLFAAVYYTLSRSERYFPSYYYSWFPDRNDNLHKLNINANYRFNARFELYASWTYHTGNRFTGPTAVIFDGENSVTEVYDMPNSYKLPDYHRLDLGFNWTKMLSNGHIRVITLSVYNVYNRLNPVFGSVEVAYNESGKPLRMKGSAIGLVPVIPTISYAWKF